jgi:hypothetical protein
MKFGVLFLLDIRPNHESAADYFCDLLSLAEEAEKLGFSYICIVEPEARGLAGAAAR